jgi:hypothetical protein
LLLHLGQRPALEVDRLQVRRVQQHHLSRIGEVGEDLPSNGIGLPHGLLHLAQPLGVVSREVEKVLGAVPRIDHLEAPDMPRSGRVDELPAIERHEPRPAALGVALQDEPPPLVSAEQLVEVRVNGGLRVSHEPVDGLVHEGDQALCSADSP